MLLIILLFYLGGHCASEIGKMYFLLDEKKKLECHFYHESIAHAKWVFEIGRKNHETIEEYTVNVSAVGSSMVSVGCKGLLTDIRRLTFA